MKISRIFGSTGPAYPRLGKFVSDLARLRYVRRFGKRHVHGPDSPVAQQSISALRERLLRGETAYLAGLGVAGHNSGAALLEVSQAGGTRILSNDEEERFQAVKHFDDYPENSIRQLQERLAERNLTPRDLHAVVLSWDYIALVCRGLRGIVEHFPKSFALGKEGAISEWDFWRNGKRVRAAPEKLAAQWGLDAPQTLICMPHHENHASFSYLFSPFNHEEKPVLVCVCDGFGDSGAMSLFLAEKGQLRKLHCNDSMCDSLGMFYTILSSTQGGWTPLSSEGRYMGAAAWGDGDRLTNPYYRQLRQIFYFGPQGQVALNREMANWHIAGELAPYGDALRAIVGDPIPQDKLWNPDSVLRVEDLKHADATHDRVDLAAATQLVFEDALFHIIDHFIRATKTDRLILTGGTALNCLANMHLVERYDEDWYRRNLGMNTRLQLWVPPTPGDAGVPMGAATSFALRAGARAGEPLRHAFYCGRPHTTAEIRAALAANSDARSSQLENIKTEAGLRNVADTIARLVAADGCIGLFQGAAETGPRALGHRSILANPCNPKTMENINLRVKFREPIRPLAPMATLAAAQKYWELSPGGSADNYNAYNYMVLTVQAKPEAYEKLPAVIHRDGTSRVQIVRPEHDPLTHAYLEAMGRRTGAEVSVNTSLNIGSPIAQTPAQGLATMLRGKNMNGLVLVSAEGDAFLAWPKAAPDPLL